MTNKFYVSKFCASSSDGAGAYTFAPDNLTFPRQNFYGMILENRAHLINDFSQAFRLLT
jgi:hypothetical protein